MLPNGTQQTRHEHLVVHIQVGGVIHRAEKLRKVSDVGVFCLLVLVFDRLQILPVIAEVKNDLRSRNTIAVVEQRAAADRCVLVQWILFALRKLGAVAELELLRNTMHC